MSSSGSSKKSNKDTTRTTNNDAAGDNNTNKTDSATAVSQFSLPEIPVVFADVTPIPQHPEDAPEYHAVCRIDYKPEFVLAYDMFRAILKRNERSSRSLKLTEWCLKLNPANYTVWHFRRLNLLQQQQQQQNNNETSETTTTTAAATSEREIERLLQNIRTDLNFAALLGGDNPKNYQIWYHRRALLEFLGTNQDILFDSSIVSAYFRDECEYIQTVISADAKNYHAWSHRQWLIQQLASWVGSSSSSSSSAASASSADTTDIWAQELAYSDTLIQKDPRNNSAWNHRWFVVHKGRQEQNQQQPILDAVVAKQEAEYALKGARLDPFNESPWRYLIAILKEQVRALESQSAAGAARGSRAKSSSHSTLNSSNTLAAAKLLQAKIELLTEFEEKAWAVNDVLQEFYTNTTTDDMEEDSKMDETTSTNPSPSMASFLEAAKKERKQQQQTQQQQAPSDDQMTTTTTDGGDGVTTATTSTTIASSPALLSAIIDILELKGDEESYEKVYAMTKVMALEHDPIRCNYWTYRNLQADDELSNLQLLEITNDDDDDTNTNTNDTSRQQQADAVRGVPTLSNLSFASSSTITTKDL